MDFKKFRQKPLDLQLLDIVIPRLVTAPAGLLTKLQEEAARKQKGYNGEKKLDYHLTQLPSEYDILCDITLRWAERPFQIDTLVITAQAIYIISVKSLEGRITFQSESKTIIQEINGHVNRYECPIIQAERHKAMLMKWLEARNLSSLPIYYIIAISEMSTNIQIKDEHIREHVHYVEAIPQVTLAMDKQHTHAPQIPLQKKIRSQILRNSEDFFMDLIQKYQIRKKDIALGVVCRNCRKLSVTFIEGKFVCRTCGELPLTGALQSLYDIMQLFKLDSISNKQAMAILKLNNRHQTLRILRKSKLIKKENTYRWYIPKK